MLHEYLKTPLGAMRISCASDGSLREVRFVKDEKVYDQSGPTRSAFTEQVDEYFRRKRTSFDLPLDFAQLGTEFQQAVWKMVTDIPFGETRTYGQIALSLGDATLARAVGRANAQNPLAIVIPCHRVIGADGSLTGYAGGLHRKAALLAFEQGQDKGLFSL